MKFLLIFLLLVTKLEPALAESSIDPLTHFIDSRGKEVTFSEVLAAKPILLSLIDYDCSSYCKQTLGLLSRELRFLREKAGEDYILVTIGLGSSERARSVSLKAIWRNTPLIKEAENNWLFLSADQGTFETVAHSLGAEFNSGAHTPLVAILEPDGSVRALVVGGLSQPGELARFFDGSLTGDHSRVNMGRVCKATHETPETRRAISWMRWGLLVVMLMMGSLLLYLVRKSA